MEATYQDRKLFLYIMIFVLELSAKNVNIYLRLSLLKVFNTKIRSTLSCTGLY